MKKLVVFVEGQTEQIFVERLLEEAAGKNNIQIEKRQATGGQATQRKLKLISASTPDSSHKFFAQIVDCGADDRVKSDIVERYEGLVSAGFETIVGIRDVYPTCLYADIQKFRRGLQFRVKTRPVEVVFVLGVMEIETWFITEYTHFQRLNSALTPDLIRARLGFDPRTDDIQLRNHPADDLNNIYHLVGLSYKKDRYRVQRTVDVLDYERMYCELPSRLPDLKTLVSVIDQFLSV